MTEQELRKIVKESKFDRSECEEISDEMAYDAAESLLMEHEGMKEAILNFLEQLTRKVGWLIDYE